MSDQPKILIVDDDRTLSPIVKEYLEAKDFECVLCHNAFDGLSAFKEQRFDLCILDVVMPMKTGFELAEEITEHDASIPFLFLTSQTDQEDRIKGLEVGADDYILKPFSMKELALRIGIILRRSAQDSSQPLQRKYSIGNYTFSATSRELSIAEDTTKLSWIEARLLTQFCEASSGIIYRDKVLRLIWSDEHSFRDRSLNVYVSKLRKYLKADPNIDIHNIHGTGYQMIIK